MARAALISSTSTLGQIVGAPHADAHPQAGVAVPSV